MPYTVDNPPDRVKDLPPYAIEIWVNAFNSALDQYEDEEKANKVAWAAVKTKYKKENGKWIRRTAKEKMKKYKKFVYPVYASDFEFSDNDLKTEIQVLPVGNWKHPVYGNINISEKDLNDFIKNFESGVRRDIPITEGHSVGEEELPAVGWFKKLVNKGRDGLWAVVEWTEEGRDLLKRKAYKYFSPEFYDSYEDPETHKKHSNVLVGGALTNRPYFKGLQAVVLSELIFNDMSLEEIIKKEIEELTDEEKSFLKEHKDELEEEQKEKFKTLFEEKEEDDDEEEEKKIEKEEEKKKEDEEDDDEEEEKKGSEKMVQLSENTLKTLQKNASEGVKAMSILRRKKAEETVNKFVFSEANKGGPLLPKAKNKALDFILSLNSKQRESFKEILGSIPKAKLFSELGEAEGISVKASEKVQALAEKLMEKNDKLDLRQAYEQVFAENPELAEEAEQE